MSIVPIGFEYDSFKFPVGEIHVRIKHAKRKSVSILFNFQRTEEIVELLLLCDAIRRRGLKLFELTVPYVPFGRQDRVAEIGEPFSISIFAQLLNSCKAERVVILDPHSDVTPTLIENCRIITQDEIFAPMLKKKRDYYLVSPDGGALKKIYKLAAKVKSLGVIECSKKRDTRTGEITGVAVHCDSIRGKDFVIVDDICDGGRTFIEIGKELKARGAGKVSLFVTHGFFTKGLEVFKGHIDEIYSAKGAVK